MKRTFFAALMTVVVLALAGCGDGGGGRPTFVAKILSDQLHDGDIQQTATNPATITVTQGNTQSLFAGINPDTGTEFRAFLDFPLSGTNGVPVNAIIASAFLDIFIDSIVLQQFTDRVPIRIDLVSFQPPTLVPTDYDRTQLPPLAPSIVFPVFRTDVGRHVTIDVTPLMTEVQRLGLPSFQVRILEDLGIVTPGLIEIDDTTGVSRSSLAPQLQVTYF